MKAALALMCIAGSAQAGTVLVVASTQDARPQAQEVAAQLGRAGLSVQQSNAGAACVDMDGKARADCFGDVAQTAWVDAVVVVSVAGAGAKQTVLLEAVARRSRKTLTEGNLTGAPEQTDAWVRTEVARIANAVKASVRAAAPPAVPKAATPAAPASPEVDAAFAAHDAPPPALVPTDQPEPAVPLAAVVTPAPAPRPKANVAAWAATGVGVVAVGAAIVLGGVALSERSQLSAANPITRISPYSYEQARMLRDTANLHAGIAIGTAVLGAAGIGVGIALW